MCFPLLCYFVRRKDASFPPIESVVAVVVVVVVLFIVVVVVLIVCIVCNITLEKAKVLSFPPI